MSLGQVRGPSPVKLFFAMLYPSREVFDWAIRQIARYVGEIDLLSEEWPFTWTDYYASIGAHLLRRFASTRGLVSPEGLFRLKHLSNFLEEISGGGEGRRVNLDPGYLDAARVVLFTTKDSAHRVYVGEGIYAEVTLRYRRGRWTFHDYTYPDYRDARYLAFFDELRRSYLGEIKKGGFRP